MQAKAIARYIHQSPFKVRKTLDSIRGRSVGDALNLLHFSPEKAAKVIEKTLRSAVSNLIVKNEDKNIDTELLAIKKAFPKAYLYNPTPIYIALWNIAKYCIAVTRDNQTGRYLWQNK